MDFEDDAHGDDGTRHELKAHMTKETSRLPDLHGHIRDFREHHQEAVFSRTQDWCLFA